MKRKLLSVLFAVIGVIAFGQTYTFTNAGASGLMGPTQSQVNTTYTSTSLNGAVKVIGGTQLWMVPASGSYSIQAVGASGGGVAGGMGANMTGEFSLAAGDTLLIIVGQQGVDGLDGSASGGGGTFVVIKDPTSSTITARGRTVRPLIIAGGGGANPGVAHADCHANTGTSGHNGMGGNGSGIGGLNGNGGGISVPSGNNRGGGGGGFLTDGERTGTCTTSGEESGASFLNGGNGGKSTSCGSGQYAGGFGGGGGAISTGWRSSGAGGGYSGGGAGQTNSVATTHRAGGGGSFNSGMNKIDTLSASAGHGTVVITVLSNCPTPGGLAANVVSCDSIVLNWTNAADSSVVAFGPAGGIPTSVNLVVGDSTLSVTGTMANTSYDFYVLNICSGDTSSIGGPFTINTGNIGVPAANFTFNSPAFNTTVNFDASLSSGASNTYAWDFGDGNTGTGVMTSHTYATGGSYNVELTVTNNCGVSDTTYTLASVGLNERELLESMTIYPNPVTDKLNISFETKGYNPVVIKVLDISGKEVAIRKLQAVNGAVDLAMNLSSLSKGVYMLQISTDTFNVNQKLIKH